MTSRSEAINKIEKKVSFEKLQGRFLSHYKFKLGEEIYATDSPLPQ